ncbi:biotin carboxylase [Massilia oculi]|uniref:biotin carboxylase n=1 Tax=Massilia oculi TaxID=945844 RepID=UPI0028B0B906|nr:biotin carboxylase [Massilia oculi]
MTVTRCPDPREHTVALLYQAMPPPVIDGIRKDPKPGGYADSGGDIAHALRMAGVKTATPGPHPDPARDLDWVFPDTPEGIAAARAAGATLLWANTVLFAGHPLEAVMDRFWIVGQLPAAMQAADDKFATNARLRAAGLPVAASILAAPEARPGVHALAALTPAALGALGLNFPLVVKPVRGRGSQGVTRVDHHAAFIETAVELVASGRFGDELIVEQFLEGAEMTVTVMPGDAPWALPPVLRFNHQNGVAPYNGVVAVSTNSRVLSPDEQATAQVTSMLEACVTAARLVQARAPIRIDCRAGTDGVLRLFDLNMKPNMTGAGRPGRDDQDSLSAIAARAIGWDYTGLLLRMLDGAWRA